jgi:hypothetical protein
MAENCRASASLYAAIAEQLSLNACKTSAGAVSGVPL